MFPENLVQACFQQIQTVYKLKKSKNATAEAAAAQLTTTVRYEERVGLNDNDLFGPFRDYQPTTATSRNLSGIADEVWQKKLEYTDGINVLGQCVAMMLLPTDAV